MRRGIGHTTKQIEEAPIGSIFVWLNGDFSYPTELARKLGRNDLKIVSPLWLENGSYRGITYPDVIVDHSVNLTRSRKYALQDAKLRMKWSSKSVVKKKLSNKEKAGIISKYARQIKCEVCGSKITKSRAETEQCPECHRMKCESCDAGILMLCVDCENKKE